MFVSPLKQHSVHIPQIHAIRFADSQCDWILIFYVFALFIAWLRPRPYGRKLSFPLRFPLMRVRNISIKTDSLQIRSMRSAKKSGVHQDCAHPAGALYTNIQSRRRLNLLNWAEILFNVQLVIKLAKGLYFKLQRRHAGGGGRWRHRLRFRRQFSFESTLGPGFREVCFRAPDPSDPSGRSGRPKRTRLMAILFCVVPCQQSCTKMFLITNKL